MTAFARSSGCLLAAMLLAASAAQAAVAPAETLQAAVCAQLCTVVAVSGTEVPGRLERNRESAAVTVRATGRSHLAVQITPASVSASAQTQGCLAQAASADLGVHGNPYALALNNTGTVQATTVVRDGGRVLLRAPPQTAQKPFAKLAIAPSDSVTDQVLGSATGRLPHTH